MDARELSDIHLEQPARGAGYRVNADAFLLARFSCARSPVDLVCDLGAGTGAIALSILTAGAARRALLIEANEDAAALAAKNAAANGLAARTEIVCGDALDAAAKHRGRAALVVCNPPFFAPGKGRLPRVAARASARFGALDRFVEAARIVGGRRARATFVYPAHELTTLLFALRGVGLEPKRLAFVHPAAGKPARVVMVEGQPGKPGGLAVDPPLFG